MPKPSAGVMEEDKNSSEPRPEGQGVLPAGGLGENALFGLKFILFAGGALLLLGTGWVEHYLIQPFSVFNAWAASKLLGHAGLEHILEGDLLSYAGKSVRVSSECSAAQVLAVFAAAALAFPRPWRERVVGLAAGFFLILGINVLRIVVLFASAVYAPAGFGVMHVYVGQAMVIAATFLVWLMYLNGVFTRRGWEQLRHVPVFRRAGVFLLTMVVGLPLYGWFIGSALATGISGNMVAVTGWLLGLVGVQAQSSGTIISVPGTSVNAISSCLAPPFLVIFYAFLFASGIRVKAKLLVALGSLPVLYLLGVAKVSSFFLFSGGGLRQGFVYNHYYPAIITGGIILLAIFAALGNDRRSAIGYAGLTAVSAAFFYLLWGFAGEGYHRFILMPLLGGLLGVESITFDPYTVLSSMPAYQLPLLAGLLFFFPDAPVKTNLGRIAVIALLLVIYQIVVIGGLNLYPVPVRAGYLRILGLAPPILAWGWYLYRFTIPSFAENKK